ncbi:MAG: CHASE2 domain-containing protein [Desulfobacter sp.]|nr:MAG: CHASE2 domain-containing protein [Desulfobacter sp.]
MFLTTLTLVSCIYFKPRLYSSLDYFFYDRFMEIGSLPESDNRIIIVDIDETSLSQIGQWPWPRYRLAQMLTALSAMAPEAVALDILLPEPDRTSLNTLKAQFKKDFNLDLEFTGIPQVLRDNDAYLAQVLAQTGTLGARYFYFDHTNASSLCKGPPVSIQDESGLLSLHRAEGVLCNQFPFEQAIESFGFTNSGYDHDGILRRLPLLIQYQDRIYPHLSLAVLMKMKGITKARIETDEFGPQVKAGPFTIPVTPKGEAAIRFSNGAKRHRSVSAVDLLNKSVPPSLIQDKIVLIGSSAVGLNDLHHTPFDTQFPGVEAQATLMDNILDQSSIVLPRWRPHLSAAFCLLASGAMALLFIYFPTPLGLLSGTLTGGLLVTLPAYFLFSHWSVFISPGMPVFILIIHFVVFAFARFALARRISFIWFKQLSTSQQLTLEAMVSMVETRDPETGAHIKRTQNYAKALATHLQQNGCFTDTLTPTYIETLYLSVPLHDIGKVGIPDRILLKEGPLTDEEFELMKRHVAYGRRIIERATRNIQGDTYLGMGAEIAGGHHEKWNGKGYPRGLLHDNIPLSARIMTICDVYDALISRRCYKPPFSHEQSMEIILEQKGEAFDPVLVDAFFSIEDEIVAIAREYQDEAEELDN